MNSSSTSVARDSGSIVLNFLQLKYTINSAWPALAPRNVESRMSSAGSARGIGGMGSIGNTKNTNNKR
jgi:hypothetical protein